jgi:Glycosyl hydrolase family 26/S-layer homology domain
MKDNKTIKTILILLGAGLLIAILLVFGWPLLKPVLPSMAATPTATVPELPTLLFGQESTPQPLDLPVFVGIYPSGPLQEVVGEITAIDSWLGKPTVTMAGTFLDLETPPSSIILELDSAWNAGYIPFVNLGAGTSVVPWTAAEIANGALDDSIHAWAAAFRDWSNNGKKRAMIAPLQEANGDWTSYGMDADNFKLIFYRIQSIFAQEGVQRDSVMWVFAPNGWSENGYEFENFYPGDTFVDAIGFSSYNFGACPVWASDNSWDTFNTIYKPYLDRMVAMAPNKPIILAEFGSVEENGDREKWLQETLTKFTQYPTMRGWVYFNRTEMGASLKCLPNTDYRIYKPELGTGSAVFKAITTQPPYGHWALTDPRIDEIMFNPIAGYFADTGEVTLLSGKASSWYASYVNRVYAAGIMSECSQTIIDLADPVPDVAVRNFCPADTVTRAQVAVFLERGLHGSAYAPPPASGTIFGDVAASSWSASWIEQASADGIVTECSSSPLMYCPDDMVTQSQMAVFLLRARHGMDYTPPPATGLFADVPATAAAAPWIEQLALEGISGGCGDGNFCPDDPVTRAQMAVFLVRTFSLP